MASARTCLFDMSECWTVRVHPRIDELDMDSGFTTGGQIIKIKGEGFHNKDHSPVVRIGSGDDSQICEVIEVTDTEITIKTPEVESPSESTMARPGQPGIRTSYK